MDMSSCGPCKRDTLQVPAAKWCQDCQEGLCNSCLLYHRKIKQTMTHIVHDTLENEAHTTLIAKFDDLLAQCPVCDEPRRATRVCVEHKSVFCEDCRDAKHQYCTDIPEVADIVSGKVTLSQQNSDEESELLALRGFENDDKNLENFNDEMEEALSELEKLNKKVEESIDQTKGAIDETFNKLATTFRKDFKDLSTQTEAGINRVKNEFESKVALIKKFQAVLSTIASDGNKNCLEIARYYLTQKKDDLMPENNEEFVEMAERLFEEGSPLKTLVDRGSMIEKVMEHLPKLGDMDDLNARAVMEEDGSELKIELKDNDVVFMTVIVNDNFFTS